MPLRDHDSVALPKFNGLWDRGCIEDVPPDHFTDCENIRFKANSFFATRYGIDIAQDVAVPLSNIKRIYNYSTPTGNTLIVLTINDAGTGEIYHVVDPTTVHGPLLSIAGMTDFGFVPYAGRGYITPFISVVTGALNIEKGMDGEFLYVYMGDGTAARKAAGDAPTGSLTIANGAAGNTDAGFHLFGVYMKLIVAILTGIGAIKVSLQSCFFGKFWGCSRIWKCYSN